MRTSFQPFLVSEFKTGMFNYLEPWIRPVDAFDPMTNAFVYRGSVNKRSGYSIFGRMSYRDNNIALGTGAQTTFSGTLLTHPIAPGSLVITDGTITFTDQGNGTLVRSPVAGGTNTINYVTGAYSVQFNVAPGLNTNISATYNPNLDRPIMGLKTWVSEVDGSKTLVAFDTRRAARYNNNTNAFEPIDSVSQIIWVGDNTTTNIGILTGWAGVSPYTNALAPFSVEITDGTDTIQDDGIGGFLHNGNALPDGTNFDVGTAVVYATGGITIDLVAPSTDNYTMTSLLVGDYFTGTSSNFFNANNWLAPAYYDTNPGFLYITNNVDPITTYDGSTLSRPPFPITEAHRIAFINDIAKALDIDVYKNRLLVQRPTLVGSANPEAQSIRFSALFQPTNLVADVTGNGGELSAPTDDFMQSSEFLRDQLIVLFANSTWSFRFTGSDFAPFRWDKINNTKSTNAPYGTVDYDERVTAMGSKGLIACDGVNVQRYDNAIIDQFLAINQSRFFQCYSTRFDSINQTWMLYPDAQTNASLSTEILVYNFIENTWSVYELPLSCLGLYVVTADKTWNDFSPSSSMPTTWDEASFPWDFYAIQGLAPTLLGGALSGGYVYQLNYGESDVRSIELEDQVIQLATGATTYSGTLPNAPVQAGTLIITSNGETFTDSGDGSLVRTPVAGGTNTINYINGAYSIQFNTAVPDGLEITADYNAVSTDVEIESDIVTTRWNPFTGIGEKVQFGYIDFYYEINQETVLDLTFYVDNSEAPCATRTLTLDGPVNSNASWKRVFINVVGEFLRMEIHNNQTEPFKFNGLVLWASGSGRLTPGRSVS